METLDRDGLEGAGFGISLINFLIQLVKMTPRHLATSPDFPSAINSIMTSYGKDTLKEDGGPPCRKLTHLRGKLEPPRRKTFGVQ